MLFFGTLILAVERLPAGDLSGQFHTFGLFQAREVTAGRLPIWSPASYGGVPFAADTQAAVFYPPRWLTILFTLPGSFSYYALEMEGLLHIWLSGVFVYFLTVAITRGRVSFEGRKQNKQANGNKSWRLKPSQWAGLLAAAAFGLGGYLTSYPLLQLAVLETMTWLPLVLLLLRLGVYADIDNPGRRSWQIPILLGAGVVLGVSALAGHPQSFLHVASLSAIYFLFLTWQAQWRPLWIFGLGILIFIVAVGTALPSFLPAFQFLPYTVRDSISYESLAEGFSLIDYVQTVIPGHFSLWLSQYTGLASLFLAILAAIGRRDWPEKRQERETVFWLLLAVFAAWLSLGDKGILFELTYRIAPGFSLFRQQERLVSLFSLALALLGGQGLVLWMRAKTDTRRQWVGRSGAIVVGLLLVAGLIFLMSRTVLGKNDWIALWLRQWLILAGAMLIMWPFSKNWKEIGLNWRSLALILLLYLDLFFPIRGAMDLQSESPTVFWPKPDWLDPLLQDRDGRLDSQGYFLVNLGELYGLEDIRGISPLKPRFLAEFEKLDRPRRWQLLNVQYVLAPEQIEEGLTKIAPLDTSIIPGETVGGFLYRFEEALPRAWMVYNVSTQLTAEESLAALNSPEFDPETQVILTDPDPATVQSVSDPSDAPHVDVRHLPGSELSMTVQTDSPGFLVVSEWAFPGWQATIDGQPADLQTVNYALLGLFIPQGSHIINLSYSPRNVYAGLFFALGTLLLAVVIGRRWRSQIPTRVVCSNRFSGFTAKAVTTNPPNPSKLLCWTRTHWLMVGIVLLGFCLRMFLLSNQELRGDEAFTFLFAQLPIAKVVPELIDQGDPHSPLHYLLLNGWVGLVGESEMAMRFLSLIPGVLLLPLLFQLGKEMLGRKLGILASFLAAVSPTLIWLSQDVRNQYMLALLFTSAATWLLVKVANPKSHFSREKKLLFWAMYILVGVLSIYSHYYGLFALVAHGLYLWFAPNRRRFVFAWVSSGAIIFLLFLPWLFVVWTGLLQAGQLSDPGSPELTAYLVNIGRELTSGSTLRGPWTRWLFLGAFLLVLYGYYKLRVNKPGWAAMLVGWLGSAALLIFLVRFSRSTFNEFYISVAAPAWILLLSVGISSWWSGRRWQRILAAGVLLVLLMAMALSISNLYFDPNYSRTRGYRQMAEIVGQNAQPGDIFIAHFPDPALDYYLRDVAVPRQMVPAENNMSDADIEQQLAQLIEQYDRAWFVPYNRSVWDEENVVPRWLDYHMLHEQEAEAGRLFLQTFRPSRTAAEIVQPINADIDNGINLQSAYLTVNGRPVNLSEQPLALASDSLLKVSLLWSTSKEIAQNYTIFVHLLDENGALIAQHDGIPLFGTRPTDTWLPGEQLLDRHEIMLPENLNSKGHLVVGLYDTDTQERMQFAPGQDALILAEVVIR